MAKSTWSRREEWGLAAGYLARATAALDLGEAKLAEVQAIFGSLRDQIIEHP